MAKSTKTFDVYVYVYVRVTMHCDNSNLSRNLYPNLYPNIYPYLNRRVAQRAVYLLDCR